MGRKRQKKRQRSAYDKDKIGVSAKTRKAQARGHGEARLSRTDIWWEAARPKTLWAGFAPVLIGCALAAANSAFDPGLAAMCLVLGIAIQIGTNYSNDYYDCIKGTDTEERVGPRRATAAGLVAPKEMRNASWLCFAITLVCTCALFMFANVPDGQRWFILVGGVVCVVSGIAYTGGPFPLGYNGLGDVFAFFFFGPVAVIGTYWMQAGNLPQEVILASLAPGLLAAALLAVNNLRDTDTDRKTGKRTLAVLLGKGFARVEYMACMGIAVLTPIVYARMTNDYWALLGLGAVIPTVYAISYLTNDADGPTLNGVLALTGKTELIFALLFSAGIVI